MSIIAVVDYDGDSEKKDNEECTSDFSFFFFFFWVLIIWIHSLDKARLNEAVLFWPRLSICEKKMALLVLRWVI